MRIAQPDTTPALMWRSRPWWIALAATALLLGGCGGDEDTPGADAAVGPGGGGGGQDVCVGKCDGLSLPADESRYQVDLAVANRIWAGGGPPASHLAELFSVTIQMPNGQSLVAATHLFGGPVKPLPYHDDDGAHVQDASGTVVFQGDRELARAFPPGSFGYAIKHHRPERRVLDFGALAAAGGSADAIKEDMKLQDTHIGLVVGIERPLGGSGERVAGVITLNNPQTYQRGRFGDEVYGMVFVRPSYPDYVPADLHRAFEDNIRTMLLGFNAVSKFPGDYNGGDPLAASTPDRVREHVRQMIIAVAGEPNERAEAREWFTRQENLIYCAELAHVATSAGLLVPINRAGLVDSGLVDEATFERFSAVMTAHNAGEPTPFSTDNGNSFARYVRADSAPAALRPLPTYAPAERAAEEASRLAFRPQTLVEIVEGFLKTHVPRDDPRLGGEALAPLQAAVLQALKPGLFEAMGMDDGLFQSMVDRAIAEIERRQETLNDPALDPIEDADRRAELEAEMADWRRRLSEAEAQLAHVRTARQAVDGLFNAVLQVVGTSHADYATFRQALGPLLAQARQIAGPRDASGTGYFVPPSAIHLVAQGNCDDGPRCGGLIGLDYVGHGIHLSAVHLQSPPAPPAPAASVRIGHLMPRPGQDYNGDGVVDARQDEYVELTNLGDASADLAGWSIADDVKIRFSFPAGATLAPGETVRVFGGGAAPGDDHTAPSGLGLNDRGDTVTLTDADDVVIDTLEYGSVERDAPVHPPEAG